MKSPFEKRDLNLFRIRNVSCLNRAIARGN